MSSGGNIGASIGSLIDVQKTSTDTQTTATDTATRASQIATKLGTDIEEITTYLRNHFQETADQLKSAVQSHLSQVEASDWSGQSKEQARQAAGDLNSQIQQVLDRAMQGVDDFKTNMTNQAQGFTQAIDQDFNRVMADSAERLGQFGPAVQAFQQRLEEADQTIRYQ